MSRLRFLTAGESHGKMLTAVVEGMPAGLDLDETYVNKQLQRRQAGHGRGDRMKIEKDSAEIVSGVRHGKTIGSPICMLVRNRDWENWQVAMSPAPVSQSVAPVTVPRPGHADLPGVLKYDFDDIRPVIERASARETAARVAAGAVARRFLEEFGVALHSHTVNIGGASVETRDTPDWDKVETSPVRCSSAEAEVEMLAVIDEAKNEGETVGGVFEVVASGVPVGIGSYVHWDRRLSSLIAGAMMGINAVKGVEIGAGFSLANLKGSEAHDGLELMENEEGLAYRHLSNRAGGIEGGMSNGEDIVVRCVIKPIATLKKPLPSFDLAARKPVASRYERSDVCVVPAAGVIGEAVLALVLADAFLEKFGGDSLRETVRNFNAYAGDLTRFKLDE